MSARTAPHPMKHKGTSGRASAEAWWYDDGAGLLVVTEMKDLDGNWIATTQQRITKRQIDAFLFRRNKEQT